MTAREEVLQRGPGCREERGGVASSGARTGVGDGQYIFLSQVDLSV